MAVWISNENNNLTADADNPDKIYCSFWNGSNWTPPSVIAEITYPIIKYSSLYDGTSAYVVLTLDTDRDTSTIDEHDLYYISYQSGVWSDLTPLINDTTPDDNPKLISRTRTRNS